MSPVDLATWLAMPAMSDALAQSPDDAAAVTSAAAPHPSWKTGKRAGQSTFELLKYC